MHGHYLSHLVALVVKHPLAVLGAWWGLIIDGRLLYSHITSINAENIMGVTGSVELLNC
jgi:hypothetical protein